MIFIRRYLDGFSDFSWIDGKRYRNSSRRRNKILYYFKYIYGLLFFLRKFILFYLMIEILYLNNISFLIENFNIFRKYL